MNKFKYSLLRIFLKTCILIALVVIGIYVRQEIVIWRAGVKFEREIKKIEKEHESQGCIIIRGLDTTKRDTINDY